MKTSSVLWLSLVVTIVVSLLSIWLYPSVQDYMAGNNMWNGISDFNDDFGSSEVDSLDELSGVSTGDVLVIIPYLEYTDDDLGMIQRFVNNGGLLLILDDFGYGNDVLTHLGLTVRFSGQPLYDPLFCYKNQTMPKISDFNPDLVDPGVGLVVLNHATSLIDAGDRVFAWSSEASYLDANENGNRDDDEPRQRFPIAADFQYGKGTVVVIADPSLIISSMLEMEDNRLFIDSFFHIQGEPGDIMLDRSHLSKTPLDSSKIQLSGVRDFAASPYTLTGVTALLFVVISRYLLRRGETSG